jgi:hypothetical protein
VRCEQWGGCAWINLDDDAPPLRASLEPAASVLDAWMLGSMRAEWWRAFRLPVNWKLAQEAFMESFHVVATHPQLLAGMGDTITQYDAFGTFARAITPNGSPSTHLKWQPTEQEMLDAIVDRSLDVPPPIVVEEGRTARRTLADHRRAQLAQVIGAEKADALSDAEMCDSIVYAVFPNFHPWGSYNRITYRFRPYGDHHDLSIMECMILSPFKGDRPPAAPLRMLGVDDDWTDAPELGLLTRVFNQDVYNLPKVQAGLESGALEEVVFARYQETKIRCLQEQLEHWVREKDA